MTSTYRQQAEVVALMGQNEAAWEVNLRRSGKRNAEADLIEERVPTLRDAWETLDKLAKEQGQ